jgi:hypothetical protein
VSRGYCSKVSGRGRGLGLAVGLFACVVATVAAGPLAAQHTAAVDVRNEVFAAGEVEGYLRVLQATGEVGLYPWSIRGFGPHEVDRRLPADTAHPWAQRYRLQRDTARGLRVQWVRPRVETIYNSAFPNGSTPGPAWAGRGLTTVAQAGFSARLGPLSLSLAPVAFRAENAAFELTPHVRPETPAFRDPRAPNNIDLPQRFGEGAYQRLDWGESSLRVDGLGVAAGISTAAQQWGPAAQHPLLLGTNAGGFTHAFAGTAAPLNLGVGRVHGRLVWGRLDASGYGPSGFDDDRRLMSGLLAVFLPRWLDGLEVGVGRFYHLPWPEGGPGLDHLLQPLESFLKQNVPDADQTPDNQVASVFARWVLPASGVEVYGEFVREDHSWDMRTLLLYPEDLSGYLVGLSRAWRPSAERAVVLRGEVMNTETSHWQRTNRGPVSIPLYRHSTLQQGHTHRGQLLVSPFGYGGAASVLGVDYYHPGGRWTAEWQRGLRGERRQAPGDRDMDVVQSITLDALLFLAGRLDLTARVAGMYNKNRNFRDDAFNLNAAVGFRWGL